MRALSIIKWVFTLIGAAQLIAANFIYTNTQKFLENSLQAEGVVVELVRSRSSDSTTYKPVVEFETQSGQQVEFSSNMGSNPPSYDIGEKVSVFYDPASPNQAKINGFFALWGLSIIFGSVGGIFFLIGTSIIIYGRKKTADIEYLKNYGVPIVAEFQSVERNGSVRVNGRNPFRIHAQWTNPATNELHVFESENLWFDPTSHIDREIISVLIEQDNPKKYHMDVSFLPKLAG